MKHGRRRVWRVMYILLVAGVAATCSDSITGPVSRVSNVVAAVDSVGVEIDDSLQVVAFAYDTAGGLVVDEPIQWSSRSAAVASVSPNGWVRGGSQGRTVVLARAGAGLDSVIVVSHAPRLVAIGASSDTLTAIRQSLQLEAVTTEGGVPVVGSYHWLSRNDTVATVTQTGRVVARRDGVVRILVREDGGRRDSVVVVVRQRVAAMTLEPATISRPMGRTQQFTATPHDAGGSFVGAPVTWRSGNPAVVSIDAGGVATALGIGGDTIVAEAGGVVASAVMTVSPVPDLRFNVDTVVLGAGQSALVELIADSVDADEQFVAHLAVADTAVLSVIDSATAPNPGASNILTLSARSPGVTTLTATASGYQQTALVTRVTPPRLLPGSALMVGLGLNEGGFISVAAGDSAGTPHTTDSQLTIRVAVSDTSVARTEDSTVVINAGHQSAGVRVFGAAPGQTVVHLSAAGYAADSVQVTVDGSARLLIAPTAAVGAGQLGAALFYVVPSVPPAAFPVAVSQRHPGVARVPAMTPYPSEDWPSAGVLEWEGLAPGVDTIVLSATGYTPATIILHVSTPHLRVSPLRPLPTAVYTDGAYFFTLLSTDSTGAQQVPGGGVLRVVVHSSDSSVLRVSRDTIVIGPEGESDVHWLVPLRPGVASLSVVDPAGQYPTLQLPSVVVSPAQVAFGLGYPRARRTTLGMRQMMGRDSVPYLTLPGNRGGATTVRLRSTNPAAARPAPDSIVFPFYVSQPTVRYEIISGDTTGTAWIVAEGPGVISDSFLVEVGHPQVGVRGQAIIGQDTLGAIAIEAQDHYGNHRSALETLVATISSTNPAVLAADSMTLTIPAGMTRSAVSRLHFITRGDAAIRANDGRTVFWAYLPGATGLRSW